MNASDIIGIISLIFFSFTIIGLSILILLGKRAERKFGEKRNPKEEKSKE